MGHMLHYTILTQIAPHSMLPQLEKLYHNLLKIYPTSRIYLMQVHGVSLIQSMLTYLSRLAWQKVELTNEG